MKLIILDRDGVINHDRDDYVKSADECVPIAGSIEAIARLHKAGFTLVVATNQAGLAKGRFELEDLEAMHEKITLLVEEQGGEIGAIFYCPHHPDDHCKCRKPKPGMLDAIEAEFNTSVESCYFVGDSLRDLQAGLQKGCKPVLVKTGKGIKTLAQLANPGEQTDNPLVSLDQVLVVDNLAAAADIIIANT
ncbi:D-glycero-beta-D-manno-heptose 1,7-bisphosphate 7-phosphatase [Cellvibrio japonicus]|nr:D-glycero-beta-D-manno-heptose 1,7-bisphosphate 7-phosphatase [Cellvibrio japonicus]QEI10812.1 D-glycero-beta-D-manno-heptose 1,7-bisphosphate 7-phosphatase [Cellvibrio japonicus]QEI14388.1 D-glycero-beta-D-manno-heptose 1,7-bisphosphate 7-phosphatase [Cellvibrio japonicus]QEI17966.1 D-glycero-beta-D-manno-heptose 1,7-bisphosphate 7-phosphatase [Cellvibrio japonicus]